MSETCGILSGPKAGQHVDADEALQHATSEALSESIWNTIYAPPNVNGQLRRIGPAIDYEPLNEDTKPMRDRIKVGDVVYLKSGGPAMTVLEIWNHGYYSRRVENGHIIIGMRRTHSTANLGWHLSDGSLVGIDGIDVQALTTTKPE